MYKNILIIGPSRVGKTTLSRKIKERYGYNIINIDHLISSFEYGFPELGIKHDGIDQKTATKLSGFLNKYLEELSEGPNFYNDNKFVVEGVHIDFEKIMQKINLKKYHIIGLTYNDITSDALYNNIKKNDTEDDWTYYCKDEELKSNTEYFVKTNSYFKNNFKKYNIQTYDVSENREKVFNKIISDLEEALKFEK